MDKKEERRKRARAHKASKNAVRFTKRTAKMEVKIASNDHMKDEISFRGTKYIPVYNWKEDPDDPRIEFYFTIKKINQ